MFGYIAPNLGTLTEEQRLRYRSVYCGLCQEIGQISGRSGRLLLSHDMTFLALLLGSLAEPEEKQSEIRCATHPVRKRPIVESRAVRYAAGMNLILMDFKCEDQIRDDHSAAAKAERNMLRKPIAELQKEYPAQYAAISEALQALWEEEQKEDPDPDRLCNLSGEMLGAAFTPAWADPFWQPSLHSLGASLGRFVYWMDAWEDREKDLKKRRFNPLRRWEGDGDLEGFTHDVLEMMMGEATGCFETLPLSQDLEILRNVLYSGVWQRYEAMKQRQEKERKKKDGT